MNSANQNRESFTVGASLTHAPFLHKGDDVKIKTQIGRICLGRQCGPFSTASDGTVFLMATGQDDAGLTTQERAILIAAYKRHMAAARDAQAKQLQPEVEMKAIIEYAQRHGVAGLEEKYVEHRNAREALERNRAAYQGTWETLFKLKGLDFRDFEVNYDEAAEELTIRKTGHHA